MPNKIGILGVAYYNTGSYGTPTWTPVPLIGDIQVSGSWQQSAVETRETRVVRQNKTKLDLSFSGKFLVNDTNTPYIAFDDAFHSAAAVIDMLILNGGSTTNGVTGFRLEVEVVGWSEDQSAGNTLYKDFELVPALTSNGAPKRAVVSAGAPVFTAIAA